MSEEQDVADRNFRSAYYKSLGVKGSEKSIAQLELLLKAEIFDVKKLKAYCLKHTLTVYYRPLVWKIILSVIPVFTDKETCLFIKEQKRTEFYDLKHALEVMGRVEHVAGSGISMVGGVVLSKSNVPSSSLSQQLSSSPGSRHPLPPPSPTSSSSSQHPSLHPPSTPSLPIPSSQPPAVQSETASSLTPTTPQSSLPPAKSSSQTVQSEHRTLPQASCSTPRDFVTIFLLENNRLLSPAVNQLKREEQVNMIAIAEAFFVLFEQESEDSIYWLFSNFVKKLESHLASMDEMQQAVSQILEDTDCALFEHINDLEATVPLDRWLCQCYAKDLPESCIESLWDRVIGGSSMVLVYVAVTILVTFKRKIFGCSSGEQLQHIFNNIPKDSFGPIVNKAIEMWESHGSPLTPSIVKPDTTFSHELYDYEIEEYT